MKTLVWMATHDLLTGLPNRLQFMEQKHELVKSLSGDQKCAVFLVDLDKFKPVNDQYGHRVGDEVLKLVSKRLSDTVDDGVVARIGGDEFGILCVFSNEDALEQIAARILHQLQQPINVAHLHIKIGASIGYTVSSTGKNDHNPLSFRDGSAAEFNIPAGGHGVARGQDKRAWPILSFSTEDGRGAAPAGRA